MALTIREYRATDLPAIRAINQLAVSKRNAEMGEAEWKPEWDTCLENIEAEFTYSGGKFFVAESGGAVAGFGGYAKEDGSTAIIKVLRVHPASWAKGIGTEIMKVIENSAGKAGFSALRMDTLKGNVRAAKMYEKLGYSKVRTIREHGRVCIVYEKKLA